MLFRSGELVAGAGVDSFAASFGIDIDDGFGVVSGTTGTINSIAINNAVVAVLEVGSGAISGSVATFNVGGDWDGTFTATGAVDTFSVAGHLNSTITADSFQNIVITGDIIGTIFTAAGGGIGSLEAADLSGTVALGTADNRGTLGSLTLGGVTGAGRLDAAIDGDGTLVYLGQNLTTSAGAAFAVTADGLSLAGNALTDFSYGATSVSLTGGAAGYFELAATTNAIGIYVTATPGGSGIDVNNAGLAANIAAIGADGIDASFDSIDIQGGLGLLGGAANRNGGDIVNVANLRLDGSLGTATISGGSTGLWTVGAGVTSLSVGGALNSLAVTGNLGTLDVGLGLGSLTVTGTISEATIGGAAGAISAGGAISELSVGGALGTLSAGAGAGTLAAGSLTTSLSITGNLAAFVTTGNVGGTINVKIGRASCRERV